MVLAGAGAVDHDELVKLAQNSFAGLFTSGAAVDNLISQDPAHFTGSDVRIRDDDMPTASFCVAFKGASWKSPDAVPLMVMQAMLGSWDKAAPGAAHAASPLAQSVRAGELANSFMTQQLRGHRSPRRPRRQRRDGRLDDAAFAVIRALRDLVYDPKVEDVTRAKQALKSSLLLQQVVPSATAGEIGRRSSPRGASRAGSSSSARCPRDGEGCGVGGIRRDPARAIGPVPAGLQLVPPVHVQQFY